MLIACRGRDAAACLTHAAAAALAAVGWHLNVQQLYMFIHEPYSAMSTCLLACERRSDIGVSKTGQKLLMLRRWPVSERVCRVASGCMVTSVHTIMRGDGITLADDCTARKFDVSYPGILRPAPFIWKVHIVINKSSNL